MMLIGCFKMLCIEYFFANDVFIKICFRRVTSVCSWPVLYEARFCASSLK